MIKINYIGLAMLLSLLSLTVNAQEKRIETGDKLFEKYAYTDAIKAYESVAEGGYKSVILFEKLGDAYYFTSVPEKAARWYGELFAMKQDVTPEYYYRYSQSLKSVGEYEKADQVLAEFAAKNGTDLRAELFENNKNYLEVIKKNSGRYHIKKTNINSYNSDYGPAFFGDKLVFASNRDSVGFTKYKDSWTNDYFTVLYAAPLTKNGGLGKVERFSSAVQTRFHESTPAFTKDKKTIYFTRNNYNNGKVQMDSKGRILLKIYRAKIDGKNWDDVTELPFNSNSYSVAHPALSSDEKTLYFASNMPGTFGESDIYRVSINADGTFGTPENLGAGINTESKETFPSIAGDRLYFASEGHPGLGGLDIFVAKMEDNGSFSKAYNVGEPVNSTTDDFAFIMNPQTKIGFFTSNRKGGQGDDIYSVTELQDIEFECVQQLTGIVTDEKTGEIFANCKVSLLDTDHNVLKTTTTDAAGMYTFPVGCGLPYYVKAERENYTPREVTVVIKNESGHTELPVAQVKPEPVVVAKAPDPEPPAIKIGTDLAKEFNIQQIYFDLGKYNIRPDAAVQLAKIISFMNEYPSAKIDVRSHTDCRASDKYNQTLSDNRAKSIIEYLVLNGINASRLTGRGYGEKQLVNKCADGVKCTEEEHQQNRRSEFIILEI
jgi:outer membrane protein OmpA-like peptidoglycan-associated protein/tetratricopeptide (TPR) repeat protein